MSSILRARPMLRCQSLFGMVHICVVAVIACRGQLLNALSPPRLSNSCFNTLPLQPAGLHACSARSIQCRSQHRIPPERRFRILTSLSSTPGDLQVLPSSSRQHARACLLPPRTRFGRSKSHSSRSAGLHAGLTVSFQQKSQC